LGWAMGDLDFRMLAQIATNLIEICGAVNGISTLLGAVITSINHYQRYTNKLLLIGVASCICAAVVPALISLLLPTNALAAAVMGTIVCVPLVLGGFWGFFLPMRIAFHGNRVGTKRIFAANLLLFIPFSWHLALWWATKPEVTWRLSQLALEENCPLEILAVHERTKRILEMLRQAGETKACERVEGALGKRVAADSLLRNLEQVLDRIMFDFELPDDIGDEIRGLTAEIRSTEHE
jgi:MFS family permease